MEDRLKLLKEAESFCEMHDIKLTYFSKAVCGNNYLFGRIAAGGDMRSRTAEKFRKIMKNKAEWNKVLKAHRKKAATELKQYRLRTKELKAIRKASTPGAH